MAMTSEALRFQMRSCMQVRGQGVMPADAEFGAGHHASRGERSTKTLSHDLSGGNIRNRGSVNVQNKQASRILSKKDPLTKKHDLCRSKAVYKLFSKQPLV